jgi:hypothetical protein
VERAEASLEQFEAFALGCKNAQHGGPLAPDLTQQLQARTVFQPFGGDDHLEGVQAQQIQAVALVRDSIDRE